MSQEEYRKSASEVDLEEEERVIQRDGTIAFFATAGLFAAGYYGLAGIVEFPTAIGERFALAATASMFVAIWVLVAIGMVSTGRRKSAKDIGGAAAGPPSDQIAIQVAIFPEYAGAGVFGGRIFCGPGSCRLRSLACADRRQCRVVRRRTDSLLPGVSGWGEGTSPRDESDDDAGHYRLSADHRIGGHRSGVASGAESRHRGIAEAQNAASLRRKTRRRGIAEGRSAEAEAL